MESDSKTGNTDHRQVVGSVSDSDRLADIHILDLCNKTEQFRFAFPVHNVADMTSGQLSIFHFKLVGVDVVNVVFLFQIVAKISKSSGKDRNLEAYFFNIRIRRSTPSVIGRFSAISCITETSKPFNKAQR